jgi:hypothetical protein
VAAGSGRDEALYSTKLESGLSSTTVHHIHATLHAALESAVALDLVVRNVADRVTPPRMQRRAEARRQAGVTAQ